jgi:mannose-6-phosphate isomerase-like protein (cupin superfamily)
LILACLATGGQFTAAQSVGAVFPESKIQKTAESLEQRVKQSGDSANNGILEEKLDEMTRVAVRAKSGLAELHQTSEEVFFVISGHATLLTGGSIENPKGTEEIRGSSITGGTSLSLAPGDVVHIPRATPHQVLIEDGKTFTYVIIKILR